MTQRTYTVTITNDSTGEEIRRMYLAQVSNIELLFTPLEKGESLEFAGKIKRNNCLYGLLKSHDVIELKNIKKVKAS